MAVGAPSTYKDSTALSICEQIASGKTLRSICKDKQMPALSTVFLWLSKHKEFSDQYARAKEMQMEAMAEEILQIADSADAETYNPARLQVDTRKWLMSKMAPKRYGDKIEHTGDLSIKTVLVPSPAKELEARPPALPAFDDDPTES